MKVWYFFNKPSCVVANPFPKDPSAGSRQYDCWIMLKKRSCQIIY